MTHTPCNRDGLLYVLPLGAVKVSNRLFWIAQWSRSNYEEYDVIEIKENKADVVLSVGAARAKPAPFLAGGERAATHVQFTTFEDPGFPALGIAAEAQLARYWRRIPER